MRRADTACAFLEDSGMKKVALLIASVFLSVGFAFAQTSEETLPEPEQKSGFSFGPYYSGNFTAGFSTGFERFAMTNEVDANLLFGANFTDNVAAEIYFRAKAYGLDGFRNSSGQFAHFDGASLFVRNVFNRVDFRALDFRIENGGSIYRDYNGEALIFPGITPRGLNTTVMIGETMHASAGFGYRDGSNTIVPSLYRSFGVAAFNFTYDDMGNDFFLTANFLSTFADGDGATSVFGGIEASFKEYLTVRIGAYCPFIDDDPLNVNAFGGKNKTAFQGGIEGKVTGKRLSIAYALYGGTDTVARKAFETPFTETAFIYVEPGFAFNEFVSMGLRLRYAYYEPNLHGAYENIIETRLPFYFTPSDFSDAFAYIGFGYSLEESKANWFFGAEASFDF